MAPTVGAKAATPTAPDRVLGNGGGFDGNDRGGRRRQGWVAGRLGLELGELSRLRDSLKREYEASLRMLHEARMELRRTLQQRQKERTRSIPSGGDGDDSGELEVSAREELAVVLRTEMEAKRALLPSQ